ncbi:MAG: porphobilinogen synthase [Deltaproteobacteria bacterium]|nr:porphobilinogen synthase [Deltaproteobacteria bacterium]
MPFPIHRMRRLRRTETLRRMVRETRLSVDNLVMPLFVCPGEGVTQPISSMPGNFRFSIDRLVEECREIAGLGIPAVILFGIPEHKNPHGEEGYEEDGIVQLAVRAVKETLPDLVVITDVCLCEYTDHGHCGVLRGEDVANDLTIELLGRMALTHAHAGADIVAPSDMMDGRVARIRQALDEGGYDQVPIMSYAAKFASAYYGPFREAADSAPSFGDRRSYQMDPPNADEAMREIALDIDEGADIVMVKPALAYLDIIHRAASSFATPIAAYNVSGEYSMVKAAAEKGWIDGERVMMETLTAIRRAGAEIILTYHAKEAARLLGG